MLTQATESHAQNLNERVGQVDEALAKGVTSLAGALKPLENLSDTVEDLSKTIQNAQVSSGS